MIRNTVKNKAFLGLLFYGLFYLICFFALEHRDVTYHIIHCSFDDMIPFCKYFIIPYILWYGYVAWSIYYFAFKVKNQNEFYHLSMTLIIGMTIFLIVSYIYPNGHILRPILDGNDFFTYVISILYQLDTSTNILPSLHVFASGACCIAIHKNKECYENKIIRIGNIVLAISIILSTMLIKQHSFIDVTFALILNVVCYWLCYLHKRI